MDAHARSRLVLKLVAGLLFVFLVASLAGTALVLVVAFLLLLVIFVVERVLWFRIPKFTKKQLIVGASVAGAILLLYAVNKLGLAFGKRGEKGRGMSLELEGFGSPGAALGTSVTLLVLAAFLAAIVYGMWRPLKGKGPKTVHYVFLGCLAAAALVPTLFMMWALLLNAAPEAPPMDGLSGTDRDRALQGHADELVAHADREAGVLAWMWFLMGIPFCAAVALPHVGAYKSEWRLHDLVRTPAPAPAPAPSGPALPPILFERRR